MADIKKYHILIKDCVTEVEEGFMLRTEKGAFNIATLPSVVPKQSQGEVTVGDLSNSSVFVQYDWSGQTEGTGNYAKAIGPVGVKYWTPVYNYSAQLPTTAYWHSSGIDVLDQPGEFKLLGTFQEKSISRMNGTVTAVVVDGADVYVGTSNGHIYKTNNDLSSHTDLGDFGDSVKQLLISTEKEVKTLFIVTTTGCSRYILSDKFPCILERDLVGYDGIGEKGSITLVDAPNSDVIATAGVTTVTTPGFDYSILPGWSTVYTVNTGGYTSEFIGKRLVNSSDFGMCKVLFVNHSNTNQKYNHDTSMEYDIPANSIVVMISLPPFPMPAGFEFILETLPVSNASSLRVGFELTQSTNFFTSTYYPRIIGITSSGVVFDCSVNIGGAGTYNVRSSSRNKVKDVSSFSGEFIQGYDISSSMVLYHVKGKDGSSMSYHKGMGFITPIKSTSYPCLINGLVDIQEHIYTKDSISAGTYAFDRKLRCNKFESLSLNNGLHGYNNNGSSVDVRLLKSYLLYDGFHTMNYIDNQIKSNIDTVEVNIFEGEEEHTFNGGNLKQTIDGGIGIGYFYNVDKYGLIGLGGGFDSITVISCDELFDPANYGSQLFCHSKDDVYTYSETGGLSKYHVEGGDLKGGVLYNGMYLTFDNNQDKFVGIDIATQGFIDWAEFNGDLNFLYSLGCNLFGSNTSHSYQYTDSVSVGHGYLTSSIYGRYMGSTQKNITRVKVLLSNQTINGDHGQKVRLALSFDGGTEFFYMAKDYGHALLPLDYSNPIDSNYECSYDDFTGDNRDACEFYIPCNQPSSQSITYRVEIYCSNTRIDYKNFSVRQVETHYQLISYKEYLLNFMIQLLYKQGTLDRGREFIRYEQRRKLDFLKNLWYNGHKVIVTMPRGETVLAIPFAVAGGGSDGFAIMINEMEKGKKDLNNLGYLVSMQFKTLGDIDF